LGQKGGRFLQEPFRGLASLCDDGRAAEESDSGSVHGVPWFLHVYPGKKTRPLRHFMLKAEYLPRQAQDEHRGKLETNARFCCRPRRAAQPDQLPPGLPPPPRYGADYCGVPPCPRRFRVDGCVRNKNDPFTFNDTKPFCVKGKVEKKTGAFFCAGYEYNGCADAMSKNGLFEPFIYKNEHFTKTVSGQIFGKHSITRPFFI